MSKKLLAILFTSLFLVMIAAPSIALIDDRFEMMAMIDFNDEEQKEGKEFESELEWKIWQPNENTSQLSCFFDRNQSDFYSNSYNLELDKEILDPPEFHF